MADKMSDRKFEQIAVNLLPVMLKQTNVKTAAIYQPLHEAIITLLLHAPLEVRSGMSKSKKCIGFIHEGAADKANPAQRKRCAQYLYLLVEKRCEIFLKDDRLEKSLVGLPLTSSSCSSQIAS